MQRVIMKTNIIVAAALLLAPSLALADENVPEKRPTNIVVHVDGDGAVLRSNTTSGFEITCVAPCNRAVPADLEYRVSANGSTSTPFTLQRDARKIDITTTTPLNLRGPGVVLTVLGGIGAIAGGSVLAIAALDHSMTSSSNGGVIVADGVLIVVPSSSQSSTASSDSFRNAMIGGGVAVGVGLAALVSGLVMFATSKRPQVVQTAIRF